MAASRAAKNAVLMLNREQIDIVDVKEIRGAATGSDVGFGQFETHIARIIAIIFGIINRYRETV